MYTKMYYYGNILLTINALLMESKFSQNTQVQMENSNKYFGEASFKNLFRKRENIILAIVILFVLVIFAVIMFAINRPNFTGYTTPTFDDEVVSAPVETEPGDDVPALKTYKLESLVKMYVPSDYEAVLSSKFNVTESYETTDHLVLIGEGFKMHIALFYEGGANQFPEYEAIGNSALFGKMYKSLGTSFSTIYGNGFAEISECIGGTVSQPCPQSQTTTQMSGVIGKQGLGVAITMRCETNGSTATCDEIASSVDIRKI